MSFQFKSWIAAAFAMLLAFSGTADAQLTVQEAFQNGYNQNAWIVSGTTCLTASGTAPTGSATQIPICSTSPACTTSSVTGGTSMSGQCGGYGDATYKSGYLAAGHNDPVGQGALRLTNSSGSQAGAIIYNGKFPSTDGIAITFQAVSYDGNLYQGTDGGNCAGTKAAGNNVSCNGADGISFFLADADLLQTVYNSGSPLNNMIGEYGGSLGYSCSSGKGDGGTGSYVGLGLDEYGNFLNSGDNSHAGITNTVSSSFGQFQGNRVGLRGAGNVNWYQLNKNFPSYYPTTIPSGMRNAVVEMTCTIGNLINFSALTSGTIYDSVTYSQLHAGQPTLYPSGLTSSQQSAAVTNTQNSGYLWNYSTPSSPFQTSTLISTTNVPTATAIYFINTNEIAVVTFAQLHTAFPAYYPSTLTTSQQTAAVTNTETTGTLWNYATPTSPVNTGTQMTTANVPGAIIMYDYAPIFYNNGTTTQYASNVMTTQLSTEGAGSRNMTTNTSGTTASPGAIMYTYSLKITSNGLLSLSYIPQTPTAGVPGGTSGTAVQIATNWPIFGTNGAPPANFTFGFAASTGGGTNIHEITCFLAQPAEDTDTSAAANALQAAQIQEYTSVYSAFYNTHGWWGQLTSTGLYTSTINCPVGTTPALPTGSNVGVCPYSNWDASCALTGDASGTTLPGGNCAATGSTSDTAIAPTSRVIYTWDTTNGNGIPFLWANLNATQKAAMGGTTASGSQDGFGQTRVSYLRGDRTQEVTATNLAAPFRPRISVLGDIINSSPVWVGSPSEPLPSGQNWSDLLYPTATMSENASATTTYSAFQTAQQGTRLNMVYVGSNDGMLHGFEGGYYSATTGTTNVNNDGKEVIAFMPNTVLNNIHNTSDQTLDFSNPNYAHNYFVDATPASSDLYYGGAWHTWIYGGLGAGGSAIYALDITNPQNFASTTAAAQSQVIGEWTPSTSGLGDLGYTYGTPQLGRFHNGQWGLVFGNGYQNSGSTHNGAVFVGLVNTTSGALSFSELKLPSSAAGTAANPNGILNVFIADIDGDSIVDYIYAGDLYGNVWRFDVTSNASSTWVSTAPTLLFSAGSGQPIFSQVQVTSISTAGNLPRIMVEFGTGAQFETPLQTTYATGQQAVYGIWDGNFGTWNTNVSVFYQVKAFPSSDTQPYTVPLSGLVQQTTTAQGTTTNNVTGASENYRVISSNTVCWAEQSSCSASQQFGWYYQFPLPSGTTSATGQTLEQVVANSYFTLGAFNVTSYIAAGIPSCSTPQGPTSWTMAFDPLTGAALTNNFFTDVTPSGLIASGIQAGSTGSSSILQLNGVIYGVSTLLQAPQGAKSVAGQTSIEAQLPPPGIGIRLNWAEIQ